MTNLRDPFATVHKKDIKNKHGEVVASVDYVGWSQVADRLDDAAPGWDFEIIKLEDDWCWGRLTLNGSRYDNVGYAENADADWKKEPLKDAVSDALKRCAALAGVARYLYDKDNTQGGQRNSSPARPPAPAPVGHPAGAEPPWAAPEPVRGSSFTPTTTTSGDDLCPVHGTPWVLKPGGTSKSTGREYSAFWACASKEQPYCKNKPSREWQARHETAA